MKQTQGISSIGFEQYLAGVEVVFTSREEYVFNIVVCRKKKNKLVIVLQEQGLAFEDCKSILKKVSQFFLVITGKGIIHKEINRFYANPNELTNALLPHAKAQDFSSQCVEMHGLFYGSVIRRESLHLVLNQFTNAKLFPSSV